MNAGVKLMIMRPLVPLRERVNGKATFPEGHPYSWSTIGYIRRLNRCKLNRFEKSFFGAVYGPE